MSVIEPIDVLTRKGTKVRLRSAEVEDAAALVEYGKSILVPGESFVTQYDEFDLSEDQEREWIRDHRDSSGSLVLVAELAGSVIGLLSFKCGIRRRIRHSGVLAISVRPAYRGEGLGSSLLRSLIEWAEANPEVEKLGLAVFATNQRAIALHEKFGFQEEGRRLREVKLESGQYVDDVLMCRFVGRPTSNDRC